MSDITLIIENQPEIELIFPNVGMPGLNGNSIVDLDLACSADGQTTFNINILPTGNHVLLVNGVENYNVLDYVVSMVGLNATLTWLDNFTLKTTDKIIFRKF